MVSSVCFSVCLAVLATVATACPPTQVSVKNEVHPVKLAHCGPAPAPLPVINEAPAVAPIVEGPPIHLPAAIPPAKTVGHHATCQKTVLKPQVYHQVIIVPYFHKYLRTCYKPVLETINYQAPLPLCPPEPVAPLPPCSAPFPPCALPPFPFCA